MKFNIKFIQVMLILFSYILPLIFPFVFLAGYLLFVIAWPFRLAFFFLKTVNLEKIMPAEFFDKDRQ